MSTLSNKTYCQGGGFSHDCNTTGGYHAGKGRLYSSTEQPHAMSGNAITNIHINNLATILTICFDIILPCGQGLLSC